MDDASALTRMPEGQQDTVVAATVRLLNAGGVGAVSVGSLCAATGLTEHQFGVDFASVGEVFAELVHRVTGAHGSGIGEITRRRSLTDLLTAVTMSFLDVLEQRPNEHQAFMCLRVAEISNPGLVAHRGPEKSVYELLVGNSQAWLEAVEQIQDISWELPTMQLATMQIGATDALILDYLIRRDRSAAEHTIRSSAYNLGTYGRRHFKNSKK